jgi:FKBP12-rapamycin complex-associated protein
MGDILCSKLFYQILSLFSRCLQVFKKIEKQLPQLTTLDLQYVSPGLLKARNLDLAVPGMLRYLSTGYSSSNCTLQKGTYLSGRQIITIESFATKLTVIASKQRPRRLSLKGSDGRDYQYGLKGKV